MLDGVRAGKPGGDRRRPGRRRGPVTDPIRWHYMSWQVAGDEMGALATAAATVRVAAAVGWDVAAVTAHEPAMIAPAAIAVAMRPVTLRFVGIASPCRGEGADSYTWPGSGH
jgi:hypothetical protein